MRLTDEPLRVSSSAGSRYDWRDLCTGSRPSSEDIWVLQMNTPKIGRFESMS